MSSVWTMGLQHSLCSDASQVGRKSELKVDAGDIRERRSPHRVTFDELPHARVFVEAMDATLKVLNHMKSAA